MAYFLGIDLSTQSIKAIVLDGDTKAQLFEAAVAFPANQYMVVGAGGRVTSPVGVWLSALDALLERLSHSGVDLALIKAISASGQQHGSVYWKHGSSSTLHSLLPSKSLTEQLASSFSFDHSPIWMDTSTSSICKELDEKVGGQEKMAALTGSRSYERFTVHQMVQRAREFPENWLLTERVSLVSSFVVSILAGQYASIDSADASGMNCMDIRSKDWVDEILAAVEEPGKMRAKLGPVVDASSLVGPISPYFVTRYGFAPSCAIIAASGDNPCSLAGLKLRVGEVAVSLGTSDTMFGPLKEPMPSTTGHILSNCIDSNSYMCMIVFSNGSLTREAIRDQYANGSWDDFNKVLASTSPGNEGNLGFYYLTPEITPSLPVGTHRFAIVDVVEMQFLSMLTHAKGVGLTVTDRILATGGASRNTAILQALSDVFGVPVSVFEVPNSAALGAAYRALFGYKRLSDKNITFHEALGDSRTYHLTIFPNPAAHEAYAKMAQRYVAIEQSLLASSRSITESIL